VRRAAPLVSVLAALLLSGCDAGPDAQAATEGGEAIAVEVAPAASDTLSALYSTSATLRAEKRATVTARTRGVVERLLVEEGDDVAAGDPLAELEDDEQRLELARARAVAEIREREHTRARDLSARGMLSENDLEAARRAAEEARHAAALAELRLERTVIAAPFAGRVVRRHLDVGAAVSDGTAVLDLADLDPLMADVRVPERHVARLAVGQTVRLAADATGVRVDGVIERLAPAVDPATGTVKVTLAVPSDAAGAGALRPGAFVRADVVTETRSGVVVPRSALVAMGRRWFVFRVGPGRAAELLEVEPGFEEGDRVEVVAAEPPLAAGDRVVVKGAAALTEGAPLDFEAE